MSVWVELSGTTNTSLEEIAKNTGRITDALERVIGPMDEDSDQNLSIRVDGGVKVYGSIGSIGY